jgi:NAD(P) transhydrogenase subunit alpha
MVGNFTKAEHEVFVETGAGIRASFSDDLYEKAGAKIVKDPTDLFSMADIVLKFQRPAINKEIGKHEVELLREGAALASSLFAMTNLDLVRMLADHRVTSFAMEHLPRISRAQSMDVLSSMSTVAGYKAVLVAANHLGKFFPLLMTAAGTIPPASVLILGAGVAGLQAIATARRLGAKVEAFDPRPAVRERTWRPPVVMQKSSQRSFCDKSVRLSLSDCQRWMRSSLPRKFSVNRRRFSSRKRWSR